jgi:hypothetical protein
MTISIARVLEEVKKALASFTAAKVTLGTPVDAEPGLYLLVYKFQEDVFSRNVAARRAQGYVLHALLMPHPPNDYALLDEGLRCLRESPILASDEGNIVVAMASLSTEELTRIFDSAGVRLRLAVPFELKWTVSG